MRTAKEAREAYNKAHTYESFQESEGWQAPRLLVEKIIPYIGKKDIVADIGCGPGNIGVEFSKIRQKISLVGVDIAENRLKEAYTKPSYTMCVQANAYHLPFAQNSFVVVISCGMVGLTGNRSIDEMRRVVKSGGYIACAIAEIKSIEWCRKRFKKTVNYFKSLPNSDIILCEDLETGYTSDYDGEHFILYILRCY